jgi:hypothetical protein
MAAAVARTPTSSEESEKTKTDVGTTDEVAPFDIFAADYPDGGARAWLIVLGVSAPRLAH